MKKTAIIFGATGLVGSRLTALLLEDDRYGKVTVFVRRSTGLDNPKLEEHIIDFEKPEEWKPLIKGDALYSALGTTIKKAKEKEAQYRVDYTYQLWAAQGAAENGVPVYVLVSSPGADPKSMIFYTRMKGELDRDIKDLPFKKIRIIKPSVLAGEREEPRLGESAAITLGNALAKVLPPVRKYRPIEGGTVASAMIAAAHDSDESPVRDYELNQIFELLES